MKLHFLSAVLLGLYSSIRSTGASLNMENLSEVMTLARRFQKEGQQPEVNVEFVPQEIGGSKTAPIQVDVIQPETPLEGLMHRLREVEKLRKQRKLDASTNIQLKVAPSNDAAAVGGEQAGVQFKFVARNNLKPHNDFAKTIVIQGNPYNLLAPKRAPPSISVVTPPTIIRDCKESSIKKLEKKLQTAHNKDKSELTQVLRAIKEMLVENKRAKEAEKKAAKAAKQAAKQAAKKKAKKQTKKQAKKPTKKTLKKAKNNARGNENDQYLTRRDLDLIIELLRGKGAKQEQKPAPAAPAAPAASASQASQGQTAVTTIMSSQDILGSF